MMGRVHTNENCADSGQSVMCRSNRRHALVIWVNPDTSTVSSALSPVKRTGGSGTRRIATTRAWPGLR